MKRKKPEELLYNLKTLYIEEISCKNCKYQMEKKIIRALDYKSFSR